MNEIWIVGATGRIGRAIAARLAESRASVVLVGRDATRLHELADRIGGGVRTLVAGSVDAVVREVARSTPAVVVNTIGPFTETAPPIVRACRPGTHYVDLANDLPAVIAQLDQHEQARSDGRTVVTGAGFGVLGTESVVLKLCQGRPPATRVRVDAIALIESGDEVVGPALAASVLDILAAGGRRYEHGTLVRVPVGRDVERLVFPEGGTALTAGVPSGELEAARRASGAAFVVAASSEAPTGRAIRAVLPLATALLSRPTIRAAGRRLLARVRVPANQHGREFTWAHAHVEWADGDTREGWLRAGEGMAYTASITAEVAGRLAHDEGRPGAYTPGALFGPDLATDAGGHFVLD